MGEGGLACFDGKPQKPKTFASKDAGGSCGEVERATVGRVAPFTSEASGSVSRKHGAKGSLTRYRDETGRDVNVMGSVSNNARYLVI